MNDYQKPEVTTFTEEELTESIEAYGVSLPPGP